MSLTIDKKLKTDFDELERLESIVDELNLVAGLDEDKKGGLLLCVSEGVTNAMLHGNKMDESKVVTLHAKAEKNKVSISIQDQGKGFNPNAVPDPLDTDNLLKTSGRGVFLMKTYCDELIYDNGGTRVTLVVNA